MVPPNGGIQGPQHIAQHRRGMTLQVSFGGLLGVAGIIMNSDYGSFPKIPY